MLAWFLQAKGEAQVSGADVADKYHEAAQSIRNSAIDVLPESVANFIDGLNEAKVFGLSVFELCFGLFAFLAILVFRVMVLRMIDRLCKPYVEKTNTTYDDKMLAALRRAASYFIIIGGLFVFFSIVQLPSEPIDLERGVWKVLNTLILVVGGLVIYRLIEIGLSFMANTRQAQDSAVLEGQLIPLLRDVSKVVILAGVVIAIVQSWGYSAASLLAGLGIGGLALAFAAQDTVANVFGSLVVYTDRPYKVGDWIQISGVEGTVEEIGVRSTRIRTFDKTLVSVPNKVVTTENIQNYSQMDLRRIKLNLGLSYDASTDQLRKVIEDVRSFIGANPEIDQGFWAVNLTNMGSSSLDVLIYCFTKTTDWAKYLAIREDLILNLIDLSKRNGVDIAFPSMSVYHKQPADDSGLPLELQAGDDPSQVKVLPQQDDQPVAEFDSDDGDG